jgi:PAS domain-containing protein
LRYELWRIRPDTGTHQVIAASTPTRTVLLEPVERTLEVPNATWTLSVAPVAGWGAPIGLLLKMALGLLFSLLLAYLARLLTELKAHQQGLEALVARRTAEVQAREADLRLASERLLLATQSANLGIFDWYIAEDELIWDDAMYRLHGIRKEDFGGAYDAWLRLLHPADFERVTTEIAEALRRVLDDGGLAKRLGEAASRKVAERFGAERTFEAYRQLYRDLLFPNRAAVETET